MSHAAPFGLAKVVAVLVVIASHVCLGDVARSGEGGARLGQELFAQELPHALLGFGLLIESAPARFVGQELQVDELVEQLFAALGGLVAEPLERVHALQCGRVFTKGDFVVAHLGEHASRQLGGETCRLSTGRCAGRGALFVGFGVATEHAQRQEVGVT